MYLLCSQFGEFYINTGCTGMVKYIVDLRNLKRENNRLTGETNTLLKESNKHLSKLRNRDGLTASFG